MINLSCINFLLTITVFGILMLSSFFLGGWIAWRCKENKEIITMPNLVEDAKTLNRTRMDEIDKEDKGFEL